MSRIINLKLPMCPSSNVYWRTRVIMPKGAGSKPFVSTYVAPEAESYKAQVRALGRLAKLPPPSGEPFRLTARIYGLRKGSDLQNREKVLFDALNGVAFVDDSQCQEVHLYRVADEVKNQRIEVCIEFLTDTLFD